MMDALTSSTDRARRAACVVGAYFDLDPHALYRQTRGDQSESFARQVAMYLLHAAFELMPTEIARGFQRDRATAEHAVEAVERLRDADDAVDEFVAHLVDVLVEVDRRGVSLATALMQARTEHGAPPRGEARHAED